MKKFILPLLVMTVALGSCNMANDDDYKNLSKDMCDCVNKNAKGMSDGMRDVLIKSGKDGSNMEALMQEHMMKNPEQGMEDINALTKIGEGMDACVNDLEKKYKDIYTNDSEKEVQEKVIAILKAEKGCELTYALMQIGLREGK